MQKKLSVLISLLFTASALAVSTSHWTQNDESDFKAGTLHNVVVTNLGDVKLSRAVKTLLEEDPKVSTVTALAQAPDGTIYAGTGPQGVLLKVDGDKVTTVATIEDTVSIDALLVDAKGGLLIGTGGAKGRVLRIDKPGDKPREIFTEKDVQYVWAMKELPDGEIYAATGPNGQLFAIHPDGSHEQIYKSDENNLTALATDGKDLLYIGTDPDGMVVRINRKTKESFVLYNAAEEEITALVLDKAGNLYAATGESTGLPQPPQADQGNKEPEGRPEATPGDQPALPSHPPTPPKPPEAPNPNPGEPAPIPKKEKVAWRRNTANLIQPMMLVTKGEDSAKKADDSAKKAEDAARQAADAGIKMADPAPAPPDQPGGPDQPGAPDQPGGPAAQPGDQKQPPTPKAGVPEQPQGNAVYKIDKDGFVNEIFREQVVIYSMVEDKGVLLVGTGSDGLIYQIDPVAEETVVLAKTDAKEVTAMFTAADGRVIMGLANTGGIAALTGGYADTGTYTSSVLDATQVSRFGAIQMHGSLPDGAAMTIATRSGNVKDADAQGWSKWTDEDPAAEFVKVHAPSARFLQYRITFTSKDGSKTSVIKDVDVAYQMPNLAPIIKSIKVADMPPQGGAPAGPPKPGDPKPVGTGTQLIAWDASDPNNDALTYALYFRRGHAGEWILLKDKLTDTNFNWDTKTVEDGRYEVKVIASDAAANPVGQGKTATRISDTVVVDNTPPVIGDLKVAVDGSSAKIEVRVTDQISTVASMEYSVDSNDVWQAVLPVDNIFDEPEAKVAISVDNLSAGAHSITLRATDAHGNVAYQSVTVTVGKAK